MTIKFTVAKSTNYLLKIEWKSLYKYQTLLLCMNTGHLIEFHDSTPTKCIMEAKHLLNQKGLTITQVSSVVDYLSPVNEVMDAISQLTFAQSFIENPPVLPYLCLVLRENPIN